MNKNLTTTLGALVAVMPFISIPGTIKNPLYIIFGIAIAVIGYQEGHYKKRGFLANTTRRGRKTIDHNLEATSFVPSIGAEIIKEDEKKFNDNDQASPPTNQ